jgi:hypothetical protein
MLAPELHLLPSPSPQESQAGEVPSTEFIVGDLIASLGGLVAEGLVAIYRTGQTSAHTKRWATATLALLCELHAAGKLDVDRAAIYGRRELRKRSGDAVNDATVDRLITAAIEVVHKVLKLRMN